MRGEKAGCFLNLFNHLGSPPRARGKAGTGQGGTGREGITPACAGKSPSFWCSSRCCTDHPRVRGEKLLGPCKLALEAGSPPRARGKEQQKTLASEMKGITPACAGKSAQGPCLTDKNKDHPRVRGEKKALPATVARSPGSPPRARGKVDGLEDEAAQFGITPACAGKSTATTSSRTRYGDHPRVRGEKPLENLPRCEVVGSPPRARGKEHRVLNGQAGDGITPACAGKSARGPAGGAACRDHPRVRGEKQNQKFLKRTGMGSPPRARGKETLADHETRITRITPACAGKSRRLHSPSAKRRDHPRVRGEKCAEWRERARKIGSPPRARGKDRLSRRSPRLAGITPACAGKSMRKFGVLGLLLGSPPRARGKGVLSSFELLNKGITPACAGKSVCFLLFDR